MIDKLLELLPSVITYTVLVTAVFITCLWLGMVLWAFRDIRSRTRDIIIQLMTVLMVGILTVPGLILYFLLRPRETLVEAYEHALEQEALLQTIQEPETCPACAAKVRNDFLYCPHCHTQLHKACVACGRVLDQEWTLCPYCGSSQGAQVVEQAIEPLLIGEKSA